MVAEEEEEEEEEEDEDEDEDEEARALEIQYWKYLSLQKAALTGDWEEAKQIIDGDGDAITAKITPDAEIALHVAVATGKSIEFVTNLVDLMPVEALELNDSAGYTALNIAARFGNTEAAKILVAKHSDLLYIRNKYDWLPLHWAAQSAHKDTLSYLLMVTKPDCKTKKPIENDLEHMAPFEDDSGVELPLLVIASGFYGPPIKHIREQKLKHNQALQLVKYLCEQVRSLEDLKAYRSLAKRPLLVAAKLGIHEIIEEIVNSFPRAILAKDSEDRNIFQLAVIKRHENVFNLLYQMGEHKQLFTRLEDDNGNTLLHLVGNQAPIEKLNVEVEKSVNPSYIEKKNDDGETPSTVFTNKHMDLVVEGEKWMKNQATSCTIAATLITAIVFTAAIIVPGGSNNTSGLPIFSTEKAFIVFVVSDAIALFMSTTSILIFLSILTSRYAEDDFLYVLPHRLIIGFVTLFLSTITMIVAVSSTLCLMLGDKNSWLLSLVVTSACLPISSFMLLQFPLLVDLMSSTYGPGIFGKQMTGSYYGSFSGLRNSHLVAMIWSDHSDEAETQIKVRSKVARTTTKSEGMADEL
ncbi:Ankyrin repeat-containing protein ITN1 [Camellia lanceoleosa]|uniref:Ankyrin repeat-containing protein ITN1 n=1 Tax=Camellia lanceoleosa TaxID=1840588 RepID=A0ACC0I346_9ERIC|nr:Ankyrin repeat-containing protein ITN1 [Camellia lanceoleosa]